MVAKASMCVYVALFFLFLLPLIARAALSHVFIFLHVIKCDEFSFVEMRFPSVSIALFVVVARNWQPLVFCGKH